MIDPLAITGATLGLGMMSDAEKQKAEEKASLEKMRRMLGLQARYVVKGTSFEWNIHAYSPEEAANKAVQLMYVNEGKTFWIRVLVNELDAEDAPALLLVPVDPATPNCSEEEHSWTESSVKGHGGGVLIMETCDHCKVRKITDTYARDAETGEIGLTSIEYKEPEEDWSYGNDSDYSDEE